MNNTHRSKPLPRHPRVWWSRFKLRWPFLVWLAALCLAILLAYESGHLGAIEGYVDARYEDAAAATPAVLESVNVKPGDRVQAGATLAQFDTSGLDGEIAAASAEFALDHARFERQFTRDLIDIRARIQELRLQHAVDQSRYDALRARRATLGVAADPLGADSRGMALYDAEQKALERAVALYPALIEALESESSQISAQIDAARAGGDETAATGGVEAARPAAAARDMLAALERRRGQYTLRARGPGIVSEVFYQPGAFVPDGETVVRILRDDSHHVAALVPEREARRVRAGQPVWATSAISGSSAFSGTIVSVSPEIVTLTNEFGVLSGQLKRGRRVTARVDDADALLPGERVTLLLNDPRWARWYRGLLQRVAAKRDEAAPGDRG